MKTNFKIEDNIYVKNDKSILYDLHNDYDFIELKWDIVSNQLMIFFDSINNSPNTRICFLHSNLSYLSLRKNEDVDNDSFNDRKTLSTISYFDSEDRNLNDHISTREVPTNNDDIIFYFENGSYVRVKCESITIEMT